MLRTLAFVVLCVCVVGACFRYTPVGGVMPGQADPVRIRLSSPQDVQLIDRTARSIVQLDGEFVRLDGAQLVLSATDLLAEGGEEYVARGESVILSRDGIASIQRKRISVPKTGLFAALVAAAIFGVDQALGGAGSEGSGNGGGPRPR